MPKMPEEEADKGEATQQDIPDYRKLSEETEEETETPAEIPEPLLDAANVGRMPELVSAAAGVEEMPEQVLDAAGEEEMPEKQEEPEDFDFDFSDEELFRKEEI